MTVVPDGNRLDIEGVVAFSNFRRLLAGIHKLRVEKGYQDVVLDFLDLEAAFTEGMLPVCAHVSDLRSSRVDMSIVSPEKESVRRLFVNANWAWLLEPRAHKQNSRLVAGSVPAQTYDDAQTLSTHIDRIVSAMLGAIGVTCSVFSYP